MRLLMPSLALGTLALGMGGPAEEKLRPLEDALWRGELEILIKGPLHFQVIANQMKGEAHKIPIGFSKEKGEMALEYRLRIQFHVNALGEFTLAGHQTYNVKQVLINEYHYKFVEEQTIAQTRVKVPRDVKVAEKKTTQVRFHGEDFFDTDSFDLGPFKMIPSGRMDSNGLLRVQGQFEIPMQGSGESVYIEERQPPSEDFGRRKTTALVKRGFTLPFQFDFEIAHRKKAVEGTYKVMVDIENPFEIEIQDEGAKGLYKSSVVGSGKFRLNPLF